MKASVYGSDNPCALSTDHGPAFLSEADSICVAHVLVSQSHSHGTARMSSTESEKSLECHKKYFHLKKKKKKAQKESSLLSPPAQCLDEDLQITAEQ